MATSLDALARLSEVLAAASGRNEKRDHIATMLGSLLPEERAIGVAYLCGTLPQGKIGVGWAALRDLDAGSPASDATLTLADVDAAVARLGATKGKGSAAERARLLGELFAKATAAERSFLSRLLGGVLRQGAEEGVLLEAIAKAANVPAPSVRRAAMLAGSIPEIGEAALARGAAGLADYQLRPFRPILPMLASPSEDVADAMEVLGEAALDVKLDGARIQVHKDGADVRVYSRSLHDVSERVPEVIEAVRALPARTLVLDGEAIALAASGAPLPFSATMRRFGRRLDVGQMRTELPLTPLFFDLVRLDDEDLLDAPLSRRAEALAGALPAALRAGRTITSDREEAQRVYDAVVASGHEGLVAKSLTGTYEAGHRGDAWLKIKPAHTLDLVVIAVERGSGRRSAWLSNIHLAARDASSPTGFAFLGKTFKGMTDEILRWQTEHLGELRTHDDGYVVWLRPETVVEVAFGDVMESPNHPCGLALRFARVRRYRTDKRAEDADTIETVRAIYERLHQER